MFTCPALKVLFSSGLIPGPPRDGHGDACPVTLGVYFIDDKIPVSCKNLLSRVPEVEEDAW